MQKYTRGQGEKPPEGWYWFSSPRFMSGIGYFHHSTTEYAWFSYGDCETWEWIDDYDDYDGDAFFLYGPLTPPEDL